MKVWVIRWRKKYQHQYGYGKLSDATLFSARKSAKLFANRDDDIILPVEIKLIK